MKIGILGGTFDPIHRGHLLLAEHAKDQYQLDKVLFIPAKTPPHKTSKSDLTPAPHRFRMVELALKNYPPFEISDIEINRPDISYTVDTLRDLRKQYPGDSFFLILGSDAAAEFLTWKQPEEILKMAQVLVALRPGFSLPAQKNFHTIKMPPVPLSATEIRERLAAGQSAGDEAIPAEVEQYIRSRKLYKKANRGPAFSS